MGKKKSKNKAKSKAESYECPICGMASETKVERCHSCTVKHHELVDLILKRSIMIRYAPLYFYDAISLYRNWLRENRRQRVLNRAKLIDEWFGKNRHNKAEKKRFWELHELFNEFVASVLISQAEEKVEEMFKVLKNR